MRFACNCKPSGEYLAVSWLQQHNELRQTSDSLCEQVINARTGDDEYWLSVDNESETDYP